MFARNYDCMDWLRIIFLSFSNDHIILFAPSLPNSGARTLELKTMNNRNINCITGVGVHIMSSKHYLLNALRIWTALKSCCCWCYPRLWSRIK